MIKFSAKALPTLALIVVQLIFGLNFAASKIVLAHYPPLLWGAFRIAIAAVFMVSVGLVVVPKEQRRWDAKFMLPVFIYAAFGLALMTGFFLMGLKYTTTANSSILSTLTPVFTLIFAIGFKREKFTIYRGLGFLLALVGVLVLRDFENFTFSLTTIQGDIFTVLSCASLAFFFAISRDFLQKNSTFWVTAWMFVFGAVLLSVAAIPDMIAFQWTPLDATVVGAAAYSIVGATMITYFLNSWALTKVNSSSVALFIYLQPVIAVLTGWAMFSEAPTIRMLVAIGFIFAGVVLGSVKKS